MREAQMAYHHQRGSVCNRAPSSRTRLDCDRRAPLERLARPLLRSLRQTASSSKSNFIPNTKVKINKLVDDYIINPSLIRNKVAHGQWKIALNKSNTAVNNGITKELTALDLVVITKWFKINRYLSNIIENLIEIT